MRIIHLLAILLFIAPTVCLSQSNFQKGYILTTKGDSINGLIDLKEWERTPESIRFKNSENEQTTTFNLTTINGFGIEGIEAYEKFTTSVSLNDIDFKWMPDKRDTTSEVRTIFLKVLEKGTHITLYSYTDKIKTRFYFKSGDNASIKELPYHPYIADGRIENAFEYANLLLSLINEIGLYSSKIESKLKTSKYEEKALLHIARYINGVAKVKKMNTTRPRFFAGVSLNQSQIRYSGDHPMAEGSVTNKSQILPGISFGIDAFKNKHVQRLLLRLEARAFLSDASVIKDAPTSLSNYTTIEHNLKYLTLSLNPQLIYNLYNRAQFKAFIGGGFSVDYINITKNDYSQNYQVADINFTSKREMDLNKNKYSFPIKVGIVVNKKFDLYLSHSFPMPISNYIYYSIYTPETSVGVNFLFNKRK